MNGDLHRLRECLHDYIHANDPAPVASQETTVILDRIEMAVRGREANPPAGIAILLAQTHLARYQVLPAGQDQAELEAAIRWYLIVLRTHPEQVPAEIRELVRNGTVGPDEPKFGNSDRLTDTELTTTLDAIRELAEDGAPRWRANLAGYLTTAYERWGQEAHLAEAITLARSVLRDGSATTAEQFVAGTNLAGALVDHAVQFSDHSSVNEAIDLYEKACAERRSAADHANAGVAHLVRFELTADMAALEEAIRHAREAVQWTPVQDPNYPARVSNLAAAIRARYDETGIEEELAEALDLAEVAVEISSPGDPALARRLSNLSAVLSTRFESSGHLDDVHRAVEIARQATVNGPRDGAAGRVSNLMLALHLRGAATGQLEDLQEAMALGRSEVSALPDGHADRSDLQSNTAGAAMSWFDWTGDIAAITNAVDLGLESVAGCGVSSRDGQLHANLSMHLLTRFEVTGDAADVEAAVAHAQQAIQWARGPAVVIANSNLAVALRTRFEITGTADDLDRALAAAREALATAPKQHRDVPALESNLALCLWHAGLRDEAVNHARAAWEHPIAIGTPSRAAYAANLARMRAELGAPPREVDGLWAFVAADLTAPIPLRLEAHLERASLPGISPAVAAVELAEAVWLLPAVAWHGVGVPSRIRRLRQWQGLGPDAAANALNATGPEVALVLLDMGLSQLWAKETRSSPQEDRLRRDHPDLASRLDSLRVALTHGR